MSSIQPALALLDGREVPRGAMENGDRGGRLLMRDDEWWSHAHDLLGQGSEQVNAVALPTVTMIAGEHERIGPLLRGAARVVLHLYAPDHASVLPADIRDERVFLERAQPRLDGA